MPMNSAQLKSTQRKNVRVVPVEPKVKSSKTCDLFKAGVSDFAKTEKIADPTCYAWSFNGGRHEPQILPTPLLIWGFPCQDPLSVIAAFFQYTRIFSVYI